MLTARHFRTVLLIVIASLLVGAFAATAAVSFASGATGGPVAPTLTRDDTYGREGTHTAKLPALGKRAAALTDLAADSRGRVLVLSNNGGESLFNAADLACDVVTVTRLDRHGRLDTRFGRGGVFRFPRLAKSTCAGGLAIDSKGRIVGTARLIFKGRRERVIFRLSQTGRLDKHFGHGGILRVGAGNWGSPLGYGSNQQLEVLDGDTIQVVTYRNVKSNAYLNYAVIERFNSDGSAARIFGGDGRVEFRDFTDAFFDVDARGRIYATGIHATEKRKRALLVRIDNRGRRDKSFGSNGTFELAHFRGGDVTFQIETIVTLSNGKTFYEIAQESSDPDRVDLRGGVVGADGKRVGAVRTQYSGLGGAVFGVDHDRRIASLENASLNDEDPQSPNTLVLGITDQEFDHVTDSPPLQDVTAGVSEIAVSEDRRDIWAASVAPTGSDVLGDVNLWYGRVLVQHLKANW